MKRECPECKAIAVEVKLLTYTTVMHCGKCFAQYEYTSLSKWVIAFSIIFFSTVAFYAGFLSQSWVVFGTTLIIVPFIAELVFAKYCSLKLVGIKGLRKKLHGES